MPNRNESSSRVVLATALRRRRRELGWSQERLADKAGLHRTYVSGVERAKRNISIDNIEQLAKALGCAPAELLMEEGK
jgi:transcriptional regulator with XRE-family HTH domain